MGSSLTFLHLVAKQINLISTTHRASCLVHSRNLQVRGARGLYGEGGLNTGDGASCWATPALAWNFNYLVYQDGSQKQGGLICSRSLLAKNGRAEFNSKFI